MKRYTNKPTDIVARGAGGFWKHLQYPEVLPEWLRDNIVNSLLKRYPQRIATIEVRQYGKLVDFFHTNLNENGN